MLANVFKCLVTAGVLSAASVSSAIAQAAVFWNPERLVNTTTFNEQSSPAVAGAAGTGGFLIAFNDHSGGSIDIRGRVFSAGGTPIVNGVNGTNGDFLINTSTSADQRLPSAAGLAGGNFAVAYQDLAGGDANIRARLFTRTGVPVANGVTGNGNDFPVNATTVNTQQNAAVAGLANGSFVVTWGDLSNLSGGTNFDIRARLFTANGTPRNNSITGTSGDFVVNTTTVAVQDFPAVAALTNGRFVIVYQDNSSSVTGSDIRARIFGASGAPLMVGGSTNDFVITTTTAQVQQRAAIAGLTNGNFVVAFQDNSATLGASYDIRARLFTANGTPVSINGSTSDFVVNTTLTNDQTSVAVAAGPQGGFFVAWHDGSHTAPDTSDAIRGQFFDAAGNPVDGEMVVNTTTDDAQSAPKVSSMADGRVLTVWQDHNQAGIGGDLSSYCVRSQILDRRNGVVIGTALPDALYGNNLLDDQITGFEDRDTLLGLDGADTLNGGSGNDILIGGLGGDNLAGAAGADVFDYNSIEESGKTPATRDTITGFVAAADKIDVSTIDAQVGGADDSFDFIEAGSINARGQVRAAASGTGTRLEFNVKGTTAPDMTILLPKVAPSSLTDTNFIP